MKVVFSIDDLRWELGKNLDYVEIVTNVEPRRESAKSYNILIYAIPKPLFLREVLGTPRIGFLIGEIATDGAYEVDIEDLWKAIKRGREETLNLNFKCRKLIERLRELVTEKKSER